MDSFVPILEINNTNLITLWPYLLLSIKNSDFVAIDLELSGLGGNRNLSRDVQERYVALREAVQSRAVFSIGICCLRRFSSNSADAVLDCATFNLLCMPTTSYTVDPQSLRFLVSHGFDLNVHCNTAIPYRLRSCQDVKFAGGDEIAILFQEIIKLKKPLILHNGLLDLMFLYHHFYTLLPGDLSTFLAHLSQLFQIYDTKYMAEFEMQWSASFLLYIFCKSCRSNGSSSKLIKLCYAQHANDFLPFVSYFGYRSKIQKRNAIVACARFAQHGGCDDVNCLKSHDIDDVLDTESALADRKRKRRARRRKQQQQKDDIEEDGETAATPVVEPLSSGCQRAAIDAFMTAYSFACMSRLLGVSCSELSQFECSEIGTRVRNKLALSGKCFPLLVCKSNFASARCNH